MQTIEEFMPYSIRLNLTASHAMVILATLTSYGPATAANSEIILEDERWRTVIQIEKLKQGKLKSQSIGSVVTGEKCGGINIGNADQAKGSSAIASREKTVIVLGPVVKADQCK